MTQKILKALLLTGFFVAAAAVTLSLQSVGTADSTSENAGIRPFGSEHQATSTVAKGGRPFGTELSTQLGNEPSAPSDPFGVEFQVRSVPSAPSDPFGVEFQVAGSGAPLGDDFHVASVPSAPSDPFGIEFQVKSSE